MRDHCGQELDEFARCREVPQAYGFRAGTTLTRFQVSITSLCNNPKPVDKETPYSFPPDSFNGPILLALMGKDSRYVIGT